jgi:hypothetical protein
MIKKSIIASLCCFFLVLPLLFWFNQSAALSRDEPVETLGQYLRYLYARDFRQAYRLLSSEDQRLKLPNEYVRERGAFNGVALDVARKLASLIEIRPLSARSEGDHRHITVAMRLPDANNLSKLLLDWDEDKLNALSVSERKKLLATLDNLSTAHGLPFIQGEETFVLVKEGAKWKVFLDWASGAQIKFAAKLSPGAQIEVEPLTKQTVARSGDSLTIGFKIRNPTSREIVTRIVHQVEPQDLAQYLELVECALLLPVRMRPGETQTYFSTYLLRSDLPEETKNVNVTYEFQIQNP